MGGDYSGMANAIPIQRMVGTVLAPEILLLVQDFP